ncbi:unnamed protein product [Caenorhabditis angaria]|uniref:Gamma-soluble NSF attachment protein n=1 Tax=Caenorhabditis angaria TaxID=860376 RepID=A0A9P1N5V3_9PELO|nr:unnamed protein product [Caenorhabditis angaria]
MSNSARLNEAVECEKKAEECLKTSMLKLKLKPDFDGAASSMERAAVCYRNSQEHKKAANSLIKAASYYEQNRNLFHAAKAREGAAMMLRDMKDFGEAVKLFELAIDGYAESGSLDTAAMTVEKAADCLKNDDPKKALDIYQKDAMISIREEVEKYLEVKELPRIGQLAIGLVLVNLANEGDSVAATKDYGWIVNQVPDFQSTEDGRVCESLIANYENGDDQSFQNVLKCGALRSMDNEYLRLMKTLKAPENSGGNGNEEEDDDDLR